MIETLLVATGTANPQAEGREAVLLGWKDDVAPHKVESAMSDSGWLPMREIMLGGLGQIEVGLRAEEGELRLRTMGAPRLYLLSHPWSGILQVFCNGKQTKVDLYNPETRVLAVDAGSGRWGSASTIELHELVQLGGGDTSPDEPPPLRIRPGGDGPVELVGIRNGDGSGDLARIAEAERAKGRTGWRLQAARGRGTAPRLIGRQDDLHLDLPSTAILEFSTSPNAGTAEIEFLNSSMRVDLRGAEGSLEVPVGDVSVRGRRLQPFTSAPLAPRSYDRLFDAIDPNRPIALYVPRWKGAAMSTRNLFDQHLPVPALADSHPDSITKDDIERYAQLLLQLGAKHFVISGGDLFWLRLIDRMHVADPDIRFDLLWHSNYLQMGEAHDWKLLTAWLDACREGKVTRFAVVKEGYDKFLRALGLDAVFIPNIVRIAPDAIVPTEVTDVVGIWLSGSSEYRKLPYASLQAVASLHPLALKASGFDATTREIAENLGVPMRRFWSRPVATNILHREMQTTAATLYVTLSECSPMLPLESLGLGVPCLVGPSSHLFRDHAALRKSLIVEQPLSPRDIAEKLVGAIADRVRIIDQYRGYAKEETARAHVAVAEFLS